MQDKNRNDRLNHHDEPGRGSEAHKPDEDAVTDHPINRRLQIETYPEILRGVGVENRVAIENGDPEKQVTRDRKQKRVIYLSPKCQGAICGLWRWTGNRQWRLSGTTCRQYLILIRGMAPGLHSGRRRLPSEQWQSEAENHSSTCPLGSARDRYLTDVTEFLQQWCTLRPCLVRIRFQLARSLCIAKARLRAEHQARMQGRVCSNTKIVHGAVRANDTKADLMLGFLSRLLPSFPKPPRLLFRRKHG
jgi:hypothetical protein